jgi:hypothetical protein
VIGFIIELSLKRHSKHTGMLLCLSCRVFLEISSHENIFGPLGMTKTSFYLTADLKSDLVRLAFKQDGQFQNWGSRFDLVEQDVTKCM